MENVKILFFNLPENLSIVGELLAYYGKKEGFEANTFTETNAVTSEILDGKNGIVIFKIENKPDLQAAVTLLKTHKKLVRKGLVKFACFSMVKSKKVDSILAKYGCNDLLDPKTLRTKTFSFKIDFWSKNIKAQIKKTEKELSLKQSSSDRTQPEPEQKESSDFIYGPGLELESDIWITKHKNDHKRILRRYLVRLMGPSPRAGQWHELENRNNSGQTVYRFDLHDDDNIFLAEDGAWFFVGSKPEFDWKTKRWSFSSDRPHLYFYRKDGKSFSKIKPGNGAIEISENSTFALTKEEAILKTCSSEFAFSGDVASKEEGQGFENENQAGGKNWEGDGDIEDLGEDKIRGKLNHQEDESGPFSGRSEFTEEELGGHYEGEGSTDELDHSGMEGSFKGDEKASKNRESEFSEDDLGGHYSGKGSTDDIDRDPLSADLRPEKKKQKEKQKESSSFRDEDLGGHYGGKATTDEVDRDPLSGGLRPNKKKKTSDARSKFDEEELGGHYGGKASSEDVDDAPLAGSIKPQPNSTEKGPKKSQFAEDDLGGHYEGDATTDEIDRDPLSGSLKPKKKKTNNARGTEFSEEDLGGHYDGESSTDNIDQGPLEGSLKPRPSSEKDAKKSDFSEDDLGGHYGGEASSDELDRDPLSGSLRPNKIKESKEANSEFSEEDLGGHYGGRSKGDDELDRDGLGSALNRKKKKRGPKYGLDEETTGEFFEDEEADSAEEGPGRKRAKLSMQDQAEEHGGPLDDELDREGKDLLGHRPRNANRPGRLTEEEVVEALEGNLTQGSSPSMGEDFDEEDEEEENALLEVTGKVITGKTKEEKRLTGTELIDGSASLNLESGELKVVLTVNGKNGDLDILCSFDDFFPDELVITASSDHLKVETQVRANIKLEYMGEKKSVRASGKVAEVEEMSDKTASVTVALSPIDDAEYEAFMELYEDRQDSIHEFMKLARGVE